MGEGVGRPPPWRLTPPGADIYMAAAAAVGTHPTRMHSCFLIFAVMVALIFENHFFLKFETVLCVISFLQAANSVFNKYARN